MNYVVLQKERIFILQCKYVTYETRQQYKYAVYIKIILLNAFGVSEIY